jgi:uncharacterized ParB-like nuclease family protein
MKKFRKIALNKIRIEAGIQTRVQLDNATIKDYRRAMLDGVEFPPVVLFETQPGAEWILADGFHRVAAAQKAGREEILAEVHQGDRQAAITYALRANDQHGRRRTNADKRKSVEIALKEFPDQSDRSLAEMCAVDKSLVASIRRRVADSTTYVPHKRIGKDGKAYPPRTPSTMVKNAKPSTQQAEKQEVSPAAGAPCEGGMLPEPKANITDPHPADMQIITSFERLIEASVTARPDSVAIYRAWFVDMVSWFDALPKPNVITTDGGAIESNATDHPTPHLTTA